MSDFILTIDSDEEESITPSNGKTQKEGKVKTEKKKLNKKLHHQHTLELNPELMLDGLGFDPNSNPDLSSRRSKLLSQFDDPLERFKKKNSAPRVSLDEIISRHQKPDDVIALSDHESEDWEDDNSSNQSTSKGSNGGAPNEDDASEPSLNDDEDLDENEEDSDQSDEDLDDDHSDADEDEDHSVILDQTEEVDDDLLEQDIEIDEPKAENEKENVSHQQYFDQSVVPFGPATKEELSKDTHEQPFSSLPGSASLSRPVLLGLSSMAITTPTPIQRQAIPLGLLGKDLVCSSVTGSGKTLGYMVPIVERLMWRDKRGGGRTRVMVLTPTRELAVQVYQVGKSLARFTDLTFSLCVGGMDLRSQEAELRERPEIVIGTPGRVIDHVRNTRGFSLETLEILVIDEADRILEEGFQDELEEIIRNCPRSRQTMLFSATVNESVADLAKLSLDKPVRIKIDPPKSTALGLTQEFLKVKDALAGKKSSLFDVTRQAILVALCKTSAFSKGRTIIFFRSKAGAHRMKIIFSLFSLRAEELHGNLTQQQRLSSLQKFKEGQTSYLLATDLASRGLDIKGVERVINYEPPTQYDVYLHRIGRTARAGTKGIALTLVGESDRKLIKEARKNCSTNSQGGIKQRKIDSTLVKKIQNEIEKLSDTISEIIKEEKEDKEMKKSEMELKKCSNLIEFDQEIKSRPARTWFQSESDKKISKQIGTTAHTAKFTPVVNNGKSLLGKPKDEAKSSNKKRDRFEGLSRKQKRRKIGQEEDAKEKVLIPAIKSSIRAAKKAQRPIKITASQSEQEKKKQDLLSLNKKKLNKSKTIGKKKDNKKKKSSVSLDMAKKTNPLQNKSSSASKITATAKKSNVKKKK